MTGGSAELILHAGDQVLIAGSARSGCSNALAIVAWQVKSKMDVVVLSPRKSTLHDVVDAMHTFEEVDQLLSFLGSSTSAVAVLVDDAHEYDDPKLADLTGHNVSLVVAAGRADRLRASFGHWTGIVRRSRTGLLLRPDRDLDGDLLGVRLPRSAHEGEAAGRAFLVTDGRTREIQVALLVTD